MNKIELGIRQEPRNQLFFDQYQYRMQFRQPYAWCMRSFDHDDLDRRMRNFHARERLTILPETIADLHLMCDRLKRLPESCKKMIQYNHVFLYSNDLEIMEDMSQVGYISDIKIGQAVAIYPKDTVMLRNPVHQYRTFFKTAWWDLDSSNRVKKFLLARQELFKITKCFGRKLQLPGRLVTHDHQFLDHSSVDDLLMLSLVCPGIIRKTLSIQAK